MHIVQAAAFPFPSMQGSQVYVHGIARGLVQLGHRVTIVCYGHGSGEIADGVEVLRVPQVGNYRSLRAGPDWVKPVLDLGLAVRLAQLRPDIVHVHNYEAPLAEWCAGFWRRAPTVYSAHNTMSEELEVYFESPFKRMLARFVGQALDRTVPRLADAAVAIRQESVSVLEGLGCRNVHCVMPGVDPSEFLGLPEVKLPPGPWVVYAGNPDQYQELDVLFEAMAQNSDDIGLLMVSSAPLSDLIPLLPEKHLLIETTSFKEVCAYISAADVAVLPRSVCSGFPMKLLNYVALGVPTVCAKGGAPEMPGLHWFEPRNADSLAKVLQAVITSNETRSQAETLQAELLRSQTWEQQASLLLSIYRDLLGS